MNKVKDIVRVSILITILIALLVLTAMLACSTANPAQAKRACETQGFSNITVNESGIMFSSWHGCGESDGAWYEVTANNPAGKRVNITVCCGAGLQLKGCTIRSR